MYVCGKMFGYSAILGENQIHVCLKSGWGLKLMFPTSYYFPNIGLNKRHRKIRVASVSDLVLTALAGDFMYFNCGSRNQKELVGLWRFCDVMDDAINRNRN